ncbi:hypothetical protein HZB90_00445, partial [archaeon]|nr:hypothetical protein [archaeon]
MYKKRFHRKAQLTLFILIGVFIIGVFAFVWYLNSSLAQGQLQAPTEKMIADLLKTGAIPYYVGVCLEQEAKQGLTYVGEQGGDIFYDEDGPAPNPTRFLPLSYRVTYGISEPYLFNGTVYPYPPGYPGGMNVSLQVPKLNFNGWGKFGEVSLRRLCDTHGANNPYIFTTWGTPTAISMPICLNNIYTDTLSTQWQLEKYIQKKVVNCTNWTAILEETGYNVTPTSDYPNITFRLGLEDVWIDAFIPLELKVGGREPVYTIGDFHARLPIRLKRIVELASFMATYDSYVLNFNLSNDYKIFSHWDTNIKVTVDTPFKPAMWEDVVTIEDSASLLDGQSYVYRFSRQNRYPALDYIHMMTNWSEYDIIVMEGQKILLTPNPLADEEDPAKRKMYDPDEDNLTYYYTGWKETCDEQFNFDWGIPRSYCSMQEPTHPSLYFKFPNVKTEVDEEKWPEYPYWKHLLDLDYLRDPREYPDEAPLNWTNSDAYIQTGRNATYTPTHDDIGPHKVTVWVCDEAGLCDYQVVRIMVFDYPELHINGTNPYHDIPYDRASVEDFYRLTAEGTRAYYTPLLGYIFNDSQEPFGYRIEHPLQILDMPWAPPDYSRDIRYIWNFTFKRENLCTTPPCLHEINLTVPMLEVPPKTMNVTVYQCLPHRNAENPQWEMWPYNDTGYDPYEASHKCCSLGGTYNKTFKVPDDTPDFVYSTPNIFGDELDHATVYDSSGNILCTREYVKPEPCTTGICLLPEYSSETTFSLAACSGISLQPFGETISAFFPSDIALGEYTIEQVTKETQPPWGAWMPIETICYGGVPKISILDRFMSADLEEQPGLLGATTTEYSEISLPDWTWNNDVIIMSFRRSCSGDRGNICSGIANRFFKIQDECEDMKPELGEVESCQGAPPTISEPKPLTPTGVDCVSSTECEPGRCIEGKCYTLPADSNCRNHGASEGIPNSFEKAFEITRIDGNPATGICNEQPTCSKSPDVYSVSQNEGKYLLSGATCSGRRGNCSEPVEGYTNCEDYNGRANAIGLPEENDWVCSLNTAKKQLFSQNFTCTEPDDSAQCTIVPKEADPDSDQRLCDACRLAPSPRPVHTGAWIESRDICCGDDAGEGGFPYTTTTSGPISAHRKSLGTSGAGTYGTEVCDDYYGTTYSPAAAIDNDCDGQV